ncbi:MAG: STM4015 family protein [Phycisphaerae bacterium]|nr:STM4015 family protein [Phycisphaerae bacterium]
MITELAETFHGLKVVDFDSAKQVSDAGIAYRIRIDWDQKEAGVKFTDVFAKLRESQHAPELRAIVIGDWGGAAEGENCQEVVEALVAARSQLAGIKALFIGDIIGEECEMSWIQLVDMSPLWNAYPELETFRVRGMEGLSLGTLRSQHLRRLIVETGGMPRRVLEQVCHADLPELEHLELWLGDDGYGWESSADELQPILSGSLFPKLKYLGLRNSCVADEVARAVADAPILERIEVLDMSLGTLGDEGAAALAESPAVTKLSKLDIHHHYVSDAVLQQLQQLGVELNADDRQAPDKWGGEAHRYVAVSE